MNRFSQRFCLLLLSATITAQARVNRFAQDERPEAYQARLLNAYNQNFNVANYDIEKENNGDQQTVPDFAGNYTKTFAHDATTSAPTTEGQNSYASLVEALDTGIQINYNSIVRDASATRQLVNPQCSAAWTMVGRDSSLTPLALPPKLDSKVAAAELTEVYLQAICRNVSFNDYGTGTGTDVNTFPGRVSDSITTDAAAVLTAYGISFTGPKMGGIVTPATLFRGNGDGCLVGPYISQFIWQDLHRINQPLLIVKPWVPSASNKEFGVTWANFLAIQNGSVPVPYGPGDFGSLRYVINGRDAGTLVHNDLPSDPYNCAYNILLNNGFPMAPNLPYFDGSMPNEEAFGTMGPPDVSQAIGQVNIEALKNAWAHKWRAARRLRPEAMAGLAHYQESTGMTTYGLDANLFADQAGINTLDWIKWYNEQQVPIDPDNSTYLLPQMYPEGSPTHPSYPAGHAVVAGACTTVLKAFMDDTALFKDYLTPVKPDPADPTMLVDLSGEGEDSMTVGGELNKLASNIALARDFAGVHYRADGDDGINLGEEIAIYFLQDWARTYMEQNFAGFQLTKRNGVRIRITADEVVTITP